MPDEVWKPVVGWDDLYEVSDIGRIRRKTSGRLLAPHTDLHGYSVLTLSDQPHGRRKLAKVHRLVAAAFLEPATDQRDQVNHIDSDKANNAAANLEWCSCLENVRHASANGHGGRPNPVTKLSAEQFLEVLALYPSVRSTRKLAARFGVHRKTIANIVNGVSQIKYFPVGEPS